MDVLFQPDGEGGTRRFVRGAGASAAHDLYPPQIVIVKNGSHSAWASGRVAC